MRRIHKMITMLLSAGMVGGVGLSEDGYAVPQGPYLGQEPPGAEARAFAPGLITTDRFEYGGVFAPDLREFYLIRERDEGQEFVVFERQAEGWRESVISPRVGQPFVAPDGRTLHLGKRYKERTASGWSEIQPLGDYFEPFRIMRLTASAQGTYVFDEVGTDGDGVLRYSRLVDGKRRAPQPFGDVINAGTWNAHPFIAPDESYILWDCKRDEGFGNSDIYVSFRQADGSWGDAINLGETINTEAWEASATVTPDGRFLFFHRMVGDDNVEIMWVDAGVLNKLRPPP